MAEHIEREALLEKISSISIRLLGFRSGKSFLHEAINSYREEILKFIKEAPTADVVEVVRCKDCEYYEPKNSLGTQGICMCGEKEMNYAGEFYPYENDFCSYGVRKEGAESG